MPEAFCALNDELELIYVTNLSRARYNFLHSSDAKFFSLFFPSCTVAKVSFYQFTLLLAIKRDSFIALTFSSSRRRCSLFFSLIGPTRADSLGHIRSAVSQLKITDS
jgi:hypothetical protein